VKYHLTKLTNLHKSESFKKSRFSRANLVVFAVIFASIGGYLIYSSFAASFTLTIDGNTRLQTMNGFGASINSDSWNNGQLKPALDMLIDQNGTKTFRVVMEMTDWEQTNDDSNANNYNWAYYNPIYDGTTTFDAAQSGSNFSNLWNTIDYLHQKGIPDNQIILSFMGIGPSWMGGTTVNASMEDEWAEMVTSAAYYGYSHGHTFGYFSPNNEEDWGHNEGIIMSSTVYADAMNKVATRLDALGLNSLKLVGPEGVSTTSGYLQVMPNYPNLLSKIDFYDAHNYSGNSDGFETLSQNNGGKQGWMSEYSNFEDGLSFIGQGIQGIMMWDAYDSVYNHAILNGLGSQPGNDAGNGPAMLSYSASTGIYTPRKQFYQFEQLFKYVPLGSVRVGTTGAGTGEQIYTFWHQATNRVTIVGENNNSSADTITANIANLPAVPAFEYYTTTNSNNFLRGADVPVSGNSFTFTAPANGIYTLTYSGVQDTAPPTASVTAPLNGSTVSGVVNVTANASDDVGVAGVQFKLDGLNMGAEDTSSPYSTSWSTGLATNGTHTLTAVARDLVGNTTTSSSVSVTVSNAPDTTPPTVTMTAPASGATVGGSVAINANAADNTGVAGVQFKLDGANLQNEDTTSPYSITWDTSTATNGPHTLTAIARDAAGNNTTSTAVPITVANTGVLVGNNNIEATSDSNSAGDAEAFKYTAAISGNSGNLSFYFAGGTATSVKVGLYSNNNGHPGTLLSSGTISSLVSGAWNSTPLAPSVNISSGTIYWVAFVGVGGSVSYRDRATGTCSESYSTAGQTTLPTTWVSGSSWPSCQLSAYVSAASGSSGPVVGDINGDNSVNITDLSLLLSSYGQSTTQCITNNAYTCDLSSPGDGIVNIFDLSILLSHYGT
jgi:hypothetical protein